LRGFPAALAPQYALGRGLEHLHQLAATLRSSFAFGKSPFDRECVVGPGDPMVGWIKYLR
jgi:hypothetical protein